MEFGLTGKNAIITGGSAGIGLSCAKALVSEGANVMIIGRDRVKLENAVNSLREIDEKRKVIAISEDLTSPSVAERIGAEAISQFGKIDILINNAGSAKAGSFWDLSDQDFLDAWTLKLLGYIRMVKAVAPYMMKEKQG
ncbi:SDR family NAD(P)-dependent oxidoreductase, partial [Bacillus dakarensis]